MTLNLDEIEKKAAELRDKHTGRGHQKPWNEGGIIATQAETILQLIAEVRRLQSEVAALSEWDEPPGGV